MIRKSGMLLLTLALTFSSTVPLFAQDATPAAPTEERAASAVYLPLVQAGQATPAATDSVEADEPVEPSEIDPATELGEAIDTLDAASHGNNRSDRCGDGRATTGGATGAAPWKLSG